MTIDTLWVHKGTRFFQEENSIGSQGPMVSSGGKL